MSFDTPGCNVQVNVKTLISWCAFEIQLQEAIDRLQGSVFLGCTIISGPYQLLANSRVYFYFYDLLLDI